jgi:hypothetical protein
MAVLDAFLDMSRGGKTLTGIIPDLSFTKVE